MAVNLAPELDREINVISRPASASPAAGSKPRHDQALEELLDEVFGK